MSDELTIDDLLRYEEEPPPRPRRKSSGVRWWAYTVFIAGGLTAVVVLGLRTFGVGVSVVAVLAGFVALLTLRRVTGWVEPPPPARSGAHGRHIVEEWRDPDGLRSAVQPYAIDLVLIDPAIFTALLPFSIGSEAIALPLDEPR